MAQPRVLGDARLAAAAERALGKLMAALPASLRDRAVTIRQRLHVDTTGWHGAAENLAMLPVVQEAVSRDRKLSFRYWRAGRERVERTVDPLGLVAKGSGWYLVARTPEGFRTYRVSRIEEARVLDRPCERPADFDLAAHWKASTARFREGWGRYDAVLRLEPRAARSLATWRSAAAHEPARPDPEGWITLRVRFDDEEQARFVALGLGPSVDVVDPEALRDRVAADAAAVARRARGRPAAPPAISPSSARARRRPRTG
jgi:predicted DNA-binding transcriptional regulator YafY